MRGDGLGGIAICDPEYPQRVAFSLISNLQQSFLDKFGDSWVKAVEDNKFTLDTMNETLMKYQDPTKADAITKIHKDLDEVCGLLRYFYFG